MREKKRLRSSVIRSIFFAPLPESLRGQLDGDGFLVIEFKTGSTWAYLVPESYADRLAAAEAPGRFYSQEIRGKMPSIRMEDGMV